MDLGEQHNDHIWLTFHGEGWAIERIKDETVFVLWQGYEPHLRYWQMIWPKEYWVYYSEFAAWMLREQAGQ